MSDHRFVTPLGQDRDTGPALVLGTLLGSAALTWWASRRLTTRSRTLEDGTPRTGSVRPRADDPAGAGAAAEPLRTGSGGAGVVTPSPGPVIERPAAVTSSAASTTFRRDRLEAAIAGRHRPAADPSRVFVPRQRRPND